MQDQEKRDGGGADGKRDDAEPHEDQGAVVMRRRFADADDQVQAAEEFGEELDHGRQTTPDVS